jgi:2-dehydropantoate 2-reductase
MFQDVRRGAPTEIDAICGAITRTGVAHGVATPVNELCWKLVSALVHATPVVVPGPRLPQTSPAE